MIAFMLNDLCRPAGIFLTLFLPAAVEVFNFDILIFWMIALCLAMPLAWVLRANRSRRWLRVLGCLAGTAAMLFDIFALGIDTPPAFFGEIALLAALFYLLLTSGQTERRVSAMPYAFR